MSEEVTAPMAGNIWKIHVKVGDQVQYEDELMILEALKISPQFRPARQQLFDLRARQKRPTARSEAR